MIPNYIPAKSLGINKQDFSSAACKVIQALNKAGYQAYLVGGCIRDFSLGLHPKDFDVATDATPEQTVKLMPRGRIIGRRFRIVHAYFGREIIEISTFRGHHNPEDKEHPHAQRNDTGQLVRDNIYGSLEDDARRRDFTVNALYYDLKKDEVINFGKSIDDIEARLIRVIGDPKQRYKEDPVRMLRAVRFAAKLDFSIETSSALAIQSESSLLNHIAPARLFDEVNKLFLSGYGASALSLVEKFDLLEILFPSLAHCDDSQFEPIIRNALSNTDVRLAASLPVTPAFFFAAVLWAPLQQVFQNLLAKSQHQTVAWREAQRIILSEQLARTSIPRRFSLPMRDIWDLQRRLPNRKGKRAFAIMQHRRFRAAYDLLLLREQSGENTNDLGAWWTAFQESNPVQQESLASDAPGTKRRRYRPRKRHNSV